MLASAAVGIAYWLLAPGLTDVSQIRDIRMQVPLRVYSEDGKLIAFFGETKRVPITVGEVRCSPDLKVATVYVPVLYGRTVDALAPRPLVP